MEHYSPDMQRWVAKQLKEATPKVFAQLYHYYQQRGGPGLVLAETEMVARNAKPAPNPVPHFLPTT